MGKLEVNQVSGPWMVADLGLGLHSSASVVGLAAPGASVHWFSSFVLSLVSLACRGLCEEALRLTGRIGFPSAELLRGHTLAPVWRSAAHTTTTQDGG